jgi:hypothetical protein
MRALSCQRNGIMDLKTKIEQAEGRVVKPRLTREACFDSHLYVRNPDETARLVNTDQEYHLLD